MIVWIWLGVGFAAGLLALATFIHFTRSAAAAAGSGHDELSPAELIRAQIKLAILEDRLAQRSSQFEQEQAAREQAARLRLAATEAAYQRQMLAMQPRLHGTAVESPLTINIHLAQPTAAAAAVEAPPAQDLAREEAGASEPAAVNPPPAPAPQQAQLLLAPPTARPLFANPQSSLLLPAEHPAIVAEVQALAGSEDALPAAGDGEQEAAGEDAILEVSETESREQESAALETEEERTAVHDSYKDPRLAAEDVALFLAVADGALEDPFDGIEPQPATEIEPAVEQLGVAAPQAALADQAAAGPSGGEPLEDLDLLTDEVRTAPSAASAPGLVPPWDDELDADFADDEALWPETAAQQKAASRWEVLPREDGDMANLEYLDSGVFAIPVLSGPKETGRNEGAPASGNEASFGRTSTLRSLEAEAGQEQYAETAVKPPEVLPDPQDIERDPYLADDDAQDPTPEELEIEAAVAQILAQAPADPPPPPDPMTESQVDRQTVEMILARAAAAAVDTQTKRSIIGAAEEETDPAYVWERQAIAWDAAYFDNIKLTGEPVLVRKDREIDFDWGPQAPGQGVPAGAFSVRWNGTLVLDPGLYRFTLHAPDGVRLWLNERLVLSAWYDQSPQEYAREFKWKGGALYVRCEHYEHGPEAFIRFDWQRVA